MTGPLEGCKVIELAHIMAGPVAGLMLADMGADVIKVEKPAGDESREILKDQGKALPFTVGFYLICSLVAAMNPNDLDAMDESHGYAGA